MISSTVLGNGYYLGQRCPRYTSPYGATRPQWIKRKHLYFSILPHHWSVLGSYHHRGKHTNHPCFLYSRYHDCVQVSAIEGLSVHYMYDICDICHTFPLQWWMILVSNCFPWIAWSADDICQSWDGTFMLLVFLCQKNIATANRSWYYESVCQCYVTSQFDELWWLGGL